MVYIANKIYSKELLILKIRTKIFPLILKIRSLISYLTLWSCHQ